MSDLLTAPPAAQRDEILEERLRDLHNALPHDFKAEFVDGELHLMSPSGGRPGRAALSIVLRLHAYERTAGGLAFGDNVGFRVNLPGRRSFSPDAAFYFGAPPTMEWIVGAPAFAVEVRSEWDYGPPMDRKLARKRADYFAAGTTVVWDVDLVGPDTIRVYRADRPDTPDVFRRGETADAEPAVPGWRFPVDELFD